MIETRKHHVYTIGYYGYRKPGVVGSSPIPNILERIDLDALELFVVDLSRIAISSLMIHAYTHNYVCTCKNL